MLVNMSDILKDAMQKKYAVAQFNINNLEWTRFILEEVDKLKVPVILGVSEGAAKYMGGYKTVANMVENLIEYLGVSVPVVLHLDHGSSFDVCKQAIDSGFTSVMIDASKYSIDENIKITKTVVKYAKENNVSTEAEVGYLKNNLDTTNTEVMYANLDECIKFCKETNIDALAPALGSAHGPYIGQPNLNFELMKDISEKCNVPLVLHGGSGISDELIKKSLNYGICKLNINTELQQAWANCVRKFLDEDKNVYDPRKIIKSGENSIKEIIDYKINILGTQSI